MHTFRDFRALRVDTEVVGTTEQLEAGGFRPGDLVEDEESGYYLYEMARWSDDGRPLRVAGAIGILSPAANSATPGNASEWAGPVNRGSAAHAGTAEIGEERALLWAFADTDVIDQVRPYRIGPIARITDLDGVAHRIYALVQPAAVDMLRKAAERAELAILGTGNERTVPSGLREMLCFFCQAKDLAELVAPVQMLFVGPGVAGTLADLPKAWAASSEPLERPHLVISGGNQRVFVPVGPSALRTLTEVRTHLASLPGVDVRHFEFPASVEAEVTSPDVVSVASPRIPAHEIITAALAGEAVDPASVGIFPRPLPALFRGEAPADG
ncbi:MAG: hypothetical protein M0Z88_07990 [Actinomycetota bacterium]|nr:hypothetical protein [Actinomycetota bacterium]